MVVTIENEFLKLGVKGSGAEMVSIRSQNDDTEYLWQGDPEFWARRAPILFPIVGKLNNHTLRVDGQEYVLPQHGFARNSMFDLCKGVANSLTFKLEANDETLKSYPYLFELYVKYELEGKKVKVTYEVKNTDNKNIYFSIGGHPGFNVPATEKEKFEDYFLEFAEEETEERYLLQDGLLTGEAEIVLKGTKTLNLTNDLFKKDALVFKSLRSSSVSLKSKKSDYHLKFNYEGWPYFGIWSPVKGAPFVCLEPWYGVADTQNFEGKFHEKEGIMCLGAGKTFSNSYSIEIISA